MFFDMLRNRSCGMGWYRRRYLVRSYFYHLNVKVMKYYWKWIPIVPISKQSQRLLE